MTKNFSLANASIEYIHLKPNGITSKIKNLLHHKRKVLFLHGLNDPVQNHIEYYQKLVESGYEVYAPNLPGHGKTDYTGNVSWVDFSEIIEEFVANLINEEINLISYSLGSAIGLHLLSRKKVKIRKAALMAPYNQFIKLFSAQEIAGVVKFYRNLQKRIGELKHMRGVPMGGDLKYLLSKYPALVSNKFEVDLVNNEIPVLLIAFAKDEVIPLSSVNKLHAVVAKSQVRIIENVGHGIYYLDKDIMSDICYYFNNS